MTVWAFSIEHYVVSIILKVTCRIPQNRPLWVTEMTPDEETETRKGKVPCPKGQGSRIQIQLCSPLIWDLWDGR